MTSREDIVGLFNYLTVCNLHAEKESYFIFKTSLVIKAKLRLCKTLQSLVMYLKLDRGGFAVVKDPTAYKEKNYTNSILYLRK